MKVILFFGILVKFKLLHNLKHILDLLGERE